MDKKSIRKKRILMVSRYYVPHVGGVERHIEHLLNILKNREYSINIITTKHDRCLASYDCIDGVNIYRISYPTIKCLGLVIIWFKLLFLYFRLVYRSDIIHIHDVFIWFIIIRFVFPFKRMYVTFHGYQNYPLSKKAILYQKIAEKLTNGNICVGDFIRKWYRTKPSKVIYGAVDHNRFKNCKEKEYDAVFSSRLDSQTGINQYIEVIDYINEEIDFTCVVLGDGPHKNKISKNVIYKGFVTDPSKYFCKSRIAFVSRYLAILEAFSSKIPVFAVYDNPLKKDYLNMTPFRKWIFIGSSPRKLSKTIKQYMKNPEKYKLRINKAYKWVKSQSWEEIARNYENIWGV